MRLIDADAYKAKMKEKQDECAKWRDEAKARQEEDVYHTANGVLSAFIEAKLTLDKMPTIDAVEVVRCKDCKFYWKNDPTQARIIPTDVPICLASPRDDAFCSEGERKETNEIN